MLFTDDAVQSGSALVVPCGSMKKSLAWDSFEPKLVAHIKKFFPFDAALLGREGLTAVVRHAADRAITYGFQHGGHLCRFTNLTISLGGWFESDPQLPWAEPILRSRSRKDPETKLRDLTQATYQYLDAVSGMNGLYFRNALGRVRALKYDMLPSVSREPAKALETLFASIYPEKARAVRGTHEVAVEIMRRRAARFKFTEGRTFTLFALLSFLLGAGFDRDPLFPWAARALAARTASPDETARALAKGGIDWLQRALRLLGAVRP